MDKIKIGFIPLNDCASLIVAKEQGFFEEQGLNVELHREVSWSNIRDKLVFGEYEAAHMLAPMLMSSTLGLGGIKRPLVTAYSFAVNGNAISVSNALYDEMSEYESQLVLKPEKSVCVLKKVIDARAKKGLPKLRFAVVFPFSMHQYLLRYWLAEGGIDADKDVHLTVVPPPSMVQALEENLIDAYCVGEPWNTHAVKRKVGVTLITGYEIWNNAPDKVLGVRKDWAEQNADTHEKIILALYRASEWLDQVENRETLSDYLSSPQYVGAPRESIKSAFYGEVCNPSCSTCRNIPDFFSPFKHLANFPWQSHAEWILTQMKRWHQIPEEVDIQGMAEEVYLTDVYRSVVSKLGVALPSVNRKEEGVHAEPWLLDGVEIGEDRFILVQN
ncbi:CmpA/NrtA family ABC transporter substrate-binding protein [Hydrogenovibrio marinus]|uniref:Nitrate transporter n=1 Tax=Hydrogenovibrio marinus TaxID=28885 RepID=A0A066ZT51_HYDMR|nr:CmpA/NrtA family ABC transporter substrate-binding protein [Hydrogenovibrio marinus]KDN95464.1 nitrate transporter [Hydrogenovibrio marinus]BBN59956.1 nitrate transporter [Hydrogenovibrio marinus]